MKNAKFLLLALLMVAVLFAAACGGNDDNGDNGDPAFDPDEPPPVGLNPPTDPPPPPTEAEIPAGTGLDPELMGTWDMYGLPGWLMIYNADGTGHRGMTGSFEDFTWETLDGSLWQHFGGTTGTELWGYVIDDGVITFSQGGVDMFWFVFLDEDADPPAAATVVIPDDAVLDDELVGKWGMFGYEVWMMIYNDDGSGQRGMEGGLEDFTWATLNGELWQDFGAYIEHYEYIIDDYVVFNNKLTGEEFYFIRLED